MDFHFENHGSPWLVRPLNDEAREHLAANVDAEAQWFGDALAVEPRYGVEDLAAGLEAAGFRTEL